MDCPPLTVNNPTNGDYMKDKDTSKKRRESRKDKQFLRDTAIPFNTQLSLPFMEAKHEKKRRK